MPSHLCSFTAGAESDAVEKAKSIASGIWWFMVSLDVGEDVQHVAPQVPVTICRMDQDIGIVPVDLWLMVFTSLQTVNDTNHSL